jgi:hypothetical protein
MIKKIILLSIIGSLFTIQSQGQQGGTIMNMLKGKWNWYYSASPMVKFTPAKVGYTRSIIFYQNKPDMQTDSLCFITYRNDTVIASGRTYIDNTYKNMYGDIFANVILEDTYFYNQCNFLSFSFFQDTSLSFSLCMTDYFFHYYKKDKLYNHVDDYIDTIYPNPNYGLYNHFDDAIKNDIYTIYPNPNNGQFTLKSYNILYTIEIYNITGKLVYLDNTLKRKTSVDIDLSYLKKGIYFARIQDSKQTVTEKIIIK